MALEDLTSKQRETVLLADYERVQGALLGLVGKVRTPEEEGRYQALLEVFQLLTARLASEGVTPPIDPAD